MILDEIQQKQLNKFEEDLEKLFIRFWIGQHLKNYDERETYIIYDKSRIEIFNKSLLDLKDNFGHFKSYYISKPISKRSWW